ACLVVDLTAEHEDGIGDRGVAIARAVSGHAPTPELLVRLGDLHRRVAHLAQVVEFGVRIDASLLEGALPHPEAAGADEVGDGPPFAVDEILARARRAQLAVAL